VVLRAETATAPPTTAKATAKARKSFFIRGSGSRFPKLGCNLAYLV
jgi:hypothetical protein